MRASLYGSSIVSAASVGLQSIGIGIGMGFGIRFGIGVVANLLGPGTA